MNISMLRSVFYGIFDRLRRLALHTAALMKVLAALARMSNWSGSQIQISVQTQIIEGQLLDTSSQ
jgi:hypothetical protein